MGRSYSDYTKSERLLHILKLMENLTRARPEQIANQICASFDDSPESPQLKRMLYRDLKSLSDQGSLRCDYFTPEGQVISPDEVENHRNLRVEYHLATSSTSVLGSGLLQNYGFQFIPQKISTISWTIAGLESGLPKNSLAFLIETQPGRWISLHVRQDELPLRLLFGRLNPDHLSNLLNERVVEILGVRTSVLLTNDSTMSRFQSSHSLGHGVISISKNGKEASVTKLSDDNKIYHCPVSTEQIIRFLSDFRTDQTRKNDLSDMIIDSDWRLLEQTQSSLPIALRMGKLRILVLRV